MTDMSKWRRRIRGAAVAALVSALLVACGKETAGESKAEDFFAGKTAELIVPFGPGGGTDVTARTLVPYLSKYIPGQPKVQVVNMAGADTITGSNKYATTEPNGLTWFMSGGSTTFNYILQNPDIQYSYKDWEPILGVPQGNVMYVSRKTGIKKPEDLGRLTEPLVQSNQGLQGTGIVQVLVLDLLGVETKLISGYSGGGEERAAFLRGEIQVLGDGTSAYLKDVVPLVQAGDAVPVFSIGLPDPSNPGAVIRDPAVADLPHIGEVYQMIYGSPPSGEKWEAFKTLLSAGYGLQKILWVHKSAPPEAIEALKQGARALKESPEYNEVVSKLGYEIVIGEELQAQVNALTNADPQILEWIKDYIKETTARLG